MISAKLNCSPRFVRKTCAVARSSKGDVSDIKVVYGSKRVLSLEKKADTIRDLALEYQNSSDEEELMETLAKVKVDIKKIEKDPLTNDFCKDVPWSSECKVFDF